MLVIENTPPRAVVSTQTFAQNRFCKFTIVYHWAIIAPISRTAPSLGKPKDYALLYIATCATWYGPEQLLVHQVSAFNIPRLR